MGMKYFPPLNSYVSGYYNFIYCACAAISSRVGVVRSENSINRCSLNQKALVSCIMFPSLQT